LDHKCRRVGQAKIIITQAFALPLIYLSRNRGLEPVGAWYGCSTCRWSA